MSQYSLSVGFMGELFKTYSPIERNLRKDFTNEFGERLSNSLLRAGCRTRADAIVLALFHSKEFAMCTNVGKVQVKQLVDWLATQPEFIMFIESMTNEVL